MTKMAVLGKGSMRDKQKVDFKVSFIHILILCMRYLQSNPNKHKLMQTIRQYGNGDPNRITYRVFFDTRVRGAGYIWQILFIR